MKTLILFINFLLVLNLNAQEASNSTIREIEGTPRPIECTEDLNDWDHPSYCDCGNKDYSWNEVLGFCELKEVSRCPKGSSFNELLGVCIPKIKFNCITLGGVQVYCDCREGYVYDFFMGECNPIAKE